MSVTALTLTDEEVTELAEAKVLFEDIINDAKHTLDNLDSYTKDEVARHFSNFLTMFEEMTKGGMALIETTIEIDQMTRDPNA